MRMQGSLLAGAPPAAIPLPARRAGIRAELGGAVLAGLLAAATGALPLLHDPGFYFTDDCQTYFLPGFLEIARLIKAGEWPVLTPRLFQGGSLLAEYQYALLNPVCLLLYLLLDGFERLDRAAAFYALTHLGLLGAGLYALARSVGTARPFAVLAGLTGATCLGMIYWGASTWVPGLVSTAWLGFAAALLMRAREEARFVAPAALAVFLVVASGWPFADAALLAGIGTGVLIVLQSGAGLRSCARVVLAAGLGFALAAPAWMPLAAAIGSTARVAEAFYPHMLQAPLPTLLAIGAPLFPQIWVSFWGPEIVASPPMHYVGWWIPVALLHGSWSRLRTPAGTGAAILLAVTLALGLLATAPGVSQLRWTFRFLPYFQIGCAVVAAWFLAQPGHRWSSSPTVILVLATAVIASFQSVALAKLNLVFALVVLAAALAVLRAGGPRTRAGLLAIGISHVVLFALLTRVFPHNGLVPEWTPPASREAYRGEPLRNGDAALLLFERPLFTHREVGGTPSGLFRVFPHGNMGLLTASASIAGYSPMRAKGFDDLCLDYIGASCPEVVDLWTRPDPVSGGSTLDLARVTRVTAQAGARADAFAAFAGPGWTRRPVEGGSVFERAGAGDLPGTLSRLPAGTVLTAASEGAREGRYEMRGEGGRVVWARAWYPGYEASWNGQPLAVEIVNGILCAAVVPAGPGVLTLRYRPAGFLPGLALATLALGATAAFALRSRRGA
ncbi:hypothetical protein [Methylobacterium sp. WSM2598]|uniref:hypothetical protein n=1 Tax=Methylobacterium sp. WSM2598 TaxID=398261 RepID=UPI001F47CBC4|nr:hypothetical protein [Methylobacterium sp. WSM2598]